MIGRAALVGLPDSIRGATTHLASLAAVVIVAIIGTSAAAVIERHRYGLTPNPSPVNPRADTRLSGDTVLTRTLSR